MNNTICSAIRSRRIIRFRHKGERMAEPYCHGASREVDDRDVLIDVLRAYQIEGHSESGNPTGWKLFHVDEMTNIVITDETFSGDRSEYDPTNDPAMATIYCCI